MARLRHRLGHPGRVALPEIDHLVRRHAATDGVPADIGDREVERRIDVLEVHFTLRGDPVQLAQRGAHGFVEGFGAGALVAAGAGEGIVINVGVLLGVATRVAPVALPEVSALVAVEGAGVSTACFR